MTASAPTQAALQIVDVSRQFGGVAALTRVSLEVAEGTIYGLIGPNGAGKTTLFNLINGIYPVSAGRILVGGRDVTGRRPAAVARAGCGAHVPEHPPVHADAVLRRTC